MRAKKLFLLPVLIFFVPRLFAFTMDVELPAKIVFAKTENEAGYRYSETRFLDLPIPIIGPIRAQYVFNPIPGSGWTFGVGASSYVYPFQTIALSGSAMYTILSFKNGGELQIKNTLDVGLFSITSSYFDVAQARTVTRPYFSPAMEYSLSLNCRPTGSSPFYFGLGPGIGLASAKGSFFLYYGLNVNLGLRLRDSA